MTRELEGLLAFQIHRGPAMKVQIKEILLKELSDSEFKGQTVRRFHRVESYSRANRCGERKVQGKEKE